jgi:hypothetical protein
MNTKLVSSPVPKSNTKICPINVLAQETTFFKRGPNKEQKYPGRQNKD